MNKSNKAALTCDSVVAPYDVGLTTQQVEAQKAVNGTNYVKQSVGKSYGAIIVDNILTVFNLIGLIVFVLMLITQSWSNAFFYIVILANTLIGIIQEVRAKQLVKKLSILSSPKAEVVRDGVKKDVNVGDLVLDDVIYLTIGKQIPADSIVIEGNIEANESLLTGESLPVPKQIGDTLLSGSFVVSGNCYARVIHIRGDNYAQKLTEQAKKYAKSKSALMKAISGIIKVIGIIVIPLSIATYFNNYSLLLADGFAGQVWREALIKTCGAVIGLIPSGMVLLTSMTLAVSVIKMSMNKALVQDLYSIEMLARVDCLCLDKTGTITDGTMAVEEIVSFDLTTHNVKQIISDLLGATGDVNDTANALASHFGRSDNVTCSEVLPFSSERKYSACTLATGETYVLGALEFVLKTVPDDLKRRQEESLSKGLRTLILASAEGNAKKLGKTTPIALIILSDTVRSDAAEIIKWFVDNNVAIKVISGDNAKSVSVIAQKVGIAGAERFISLDGLTDEQVAEAATQYTVFGRVKPDQKAILVTALKKGGKTVAMTGDGVNDILAMKKADCAVTVASGSEAARSVAHIVLTDNKFASMPKIVAEGRQVVNNIQNSSALFLMKTIMTLCTTIFTLIIRAEYPFEPLHLYAIEFCIIGAPAFFLALRKNTQLIRGKFINNTLYSTLPKGIALASAVMLTYAFASVIGISGDNQAITTIAMLAMTYAGVAGLFVLCFPYKLANVLVAVGSLLLTTGCFAMLNAFGNSGLPMFKDFEGYLYGLNGTTVVYLLCSAVFSTLIIVAGNIIANKIKHKNIGEN